ncbi:MAG: hypothetical protein KF812_04510 [Fimbriimonadaceae bacterium]|nr:hypothetical protein [Fimbriimonadaceae bacterium]
MALHLHLADSSDPRRTEAFLRTQPDVVDASVWSSNGALLSRVTVSQDSRLSPSDIQHACRSNLGAAMTPRLVMLERAIRRAA